MQLSHKLIIALILQLAYPANAGEARYFDPNIGCLRSTDDDVFIRTGVKQIEIGLPLIDIPVNLTSCANEGMREVLGVIKNLLSPLEQQLEGRDVSETGPSSKGREKRFIGALIMGIIGVISVGSFGMATGALAMAVENKAQIKAMKGDIAKSKEAIEKLTGVTKKLVHSVGVIQEYITHVIVPVLQRLSCSTEAIAVKAHAALLLHTIQPVLSVISNNPDNAPFPMSLLTPLLVNRIRAEMADLADNIIAYNNNPMAWLKDSVVTVTGVDQDNAVVWMIVSLPTLTRMRGAELVSFDCLCFNDPTSGEPRRTQTQKNYLHIDGRLFHIEDRHIVSVGGKRAILEWTGNLLPAEMTSCLMNGVINSCLFATCPVSTWSYIKQSKGNYIVNTQAGDLACTNPPSLNFGSELGKSYKLITTKDCRDWTIQTTRVKSVSVVNGTIFVLPVIANFTLESFPVQQFINPLNVSEVEKELEGVLGILAGVGSWDLPGTGMGWMAALIILIVIAYIILFFVICLGCRKMKRLEASNHPTAYFIKNQDTKKLPMELSLG